MLRTLLGLALIFCTQHAIAGSLLQVDTKNIQDYWILDQGQMASTSPVDISRLSRQYEGQLRYSYEVTINKNGRPIGFELKKISPEDAMNEAEQLRRLTLFKRYRPGPKNPGGDPVRLVAKDIRIWTPGVHQRNPD